ncbi:hypothetical protein ABZP36_016572 [Zizania latifolia]
MGRGGPNVPEGTSSRGQLASNSALFLLPTQVPNLRPSVRRYRSGQLLGTVAGVVTKRAREEAEILAAEGGVEERVLTELLCLLLLVEMDVEMVKAAVKEETVKDKERVENSRRPARGAVRPSSSRCRCDRQPLACRRSYCAL